MQDMIERADRCSMLSNARRSRWVRMSAAARAALKADRTRGPSWAIKRHVPRWRTREEAANIGCSLWCAHVTDQEKKLKTVIVEVARNERSWSPILDGHAYRSSFQSELHQETTCLLRGRGIQPSSALRWSDWLSSYYVSVTFGNYEIEIFEDRANLLLRPILDEHFEVGDFGDLDHLKQAALRLLETLLDYDRAPFEKAIKTAIEGRIGSPVNIYNSHPRPGVFSFERLNDTYAQRINWQEVATELARETNIAVLFVGHTWTGPPDNLDITLIAFHVPHLTEGYVEDNRNVIEPVSPSGHTFEEGNPRGR
jgi:hypothetical protein